MDLNAAKALLETLVFAIEQAVVLNDRNALVLVTEVFRVILAEDKDFILQVLHHLLEVFEE